MYQTYPKESFGEKTVKAMHSRDDTKVKKCDVILAHSLVALEDSLPVWKKALSPGGVVICIAPKSAFARRIAGVGGMVSEEIDASGDQKLMAFLRAVFVFQNSF